MYSKNSYEPSVKPWQQEIPSKTPPFDQRPEAIAQRKIQQLSNESSQQKSLQHYQQMANQKNEATGGTIQQRENRTGLPDNLKSGLENISGLAMDDVRVHYNSDKPQKLDALAYAKGTDIHIAPGQERHLPHEAWHIVQQKQGRVKPTMQMKGVKVNDDDYLEREADIMGSKAAQWNQQTGSNQTKNIQNNTPNVSGAPIQRLRDKLKMTKEQYKKATFNTVYLYAEFEKKPLGGNGLFKTEKGNHAEENLIKEIGSKYQNGTLEIWLSTSPCSSVFCTRMDGKLGCQENLEKLQTDNNIVIKVHADHLYLKQDIRSQEVEVMGAGTSGFSSLSSAYTSTFDIDFSTLPKKLYDEEMVTETDVAQLQRKN